MRLKFKRHALSALAITLGLIGCFGDGDDAVTASIVNLGDTGTSLLTSVATEAALEVQRVGIDTTDGTLRLPVSTLPAAVEDTFPFIWVANSAEGTISKLDTRTGRELGRYKTAPAGDPSNPSRTTVDQDGNVWVGNRNSSTVTKVGLKEFGQCIDRNSNGVIDTSVGGTDTKAWNAGAGITGATDECILKHVSLTDAGLGALSNVRTVAIDPQNNVFVGGSNDNKIFKINGSTGAIITASTSLQGHYGGVVDKLGNLWSMQSGSGKVQKTTPDLSSSTLYDLGHSGYGIGIDKYGKIWTTEYGVRFSTFDPANPVASLMVFNQTGNSAAQGITTDDNGDIFIAGSLSGNTVGHYKQVFNTVTGVFTGVSFVANYTVGRAPTGVAVDGAGKVWSTNVDDNNTSRITLAANPANAVVENFAVGLGPYNYSDMTGRVVRTITTRQGTWEATLDGGRTDFAWSKVIWRLKQALPAGTQVEASYKVVNAETRIAAQAAFGAIEYTTAVNDASLSNVKGRFMKIRFRLTSDSVTKTPEINGITVR